MKCKFYLILTILFVSITLPMTIHAQDSPQWHLPHQAKMRLGKGYPGEIAYSPDGTKLAVASSIGIWIYDTQTGEELNLFTGGNGFFNTIAFSPDGKMLASDLNGRLLCLWNVETGMQIRTFSGHNHYDIYTIAFSSNGKMFASGGSGGTVRLWDVETGREIHTLRPHARSVTSLAFSPDGKTLVSSAPFNKTFYLWDVETGLILRRFTGHTDGVNGVTFHPDGKIIASCSSDNTIRLWDVENGEEQKSISRYTDSFYPVVFSPDGNTLAGASMDNTIRLWHVSNLEKRYDLIGHTSRITSIAFSPDSLNLASMSFDDNIRLWNIQKSWTRLKISGHFVGMGTPIAFSPDSSTLASDTRDGVIHLWDVVTGTQIQELKGHTDYIKSLAFNPDGNTIISGSADGTVRLWYMDTGLEHRTLKRLSGDVDSVMFSPDGKIAVSAITTGEYNPRLLLRNSIISVFDVESAIELHTIAAYNAPPPPAYSYEPVFLPTEHSLPIRNIAMSPNGRVIASYSGDKTIRLWDVETGVHLRVLTQKAGNYGSMVFSPYGDLLVCSGYKTISLWNVTSGELVHKIISPKEDIDAIAISPDGKILASGGEDNIIRLWDLYSGLHLHTLIEYIGIYNYRGRFSSVAFSPDGRTLASGHSSGTILLWDAIPPEPSKTNVRLSPANVVSPVKGKQLSLSITVAEGHNIAGYQATLHFDSTALRYVESRNGNYLDASTYVIEPVIDGGRVTIAATTYSEESFDDGTLATITFEIINAKTNTVLLSDVLFTDSTGKSTKPKITASTKITEPTFLSEDINMDGVVNILDLTFIATNFGKTGKNIADVNSDGIVNIVDLTLVAAVIGNKATDSAAPALLTKMPTRATVAAWLHEARKLNLSNLKIQHGVFFLENLLKTLTPIETVLLPNYPNPFNPDTWIPYQLALPEEVYITIYTVEGKLIRRLELGYHNVGIYYHRSRAAYWDGRNTHGEPVASGVYLYTLSAGNYTVTRKMLVKK